MIDRISNATVGAGMVSATYYRNAINQGRIYTDTEKALNVFVREQFPEWGCKAI